MIRLVSVYKDQPTRDIAYGVLYALLAQRDASESISHRFMPSMAQHVRYVDSEPYRAWYLVYVEHLPEPVGCCYVSKINEIGISIDQKHRRKGYGRGALEAIIRLHQGETLLANVRTENLKSIHLFKSAGFMPLQTTYRLEVPK
jgi:RimJ/RimL family protein N-acetyltransferase